MMVATVRPTIKPITVRFAESITKLFPDSSNALGVCCPLADCGLYIMTNGDLSVMGSTYLFVVLSNTNHAATVCGQRSD
jgi:hypothetical protein